jgi:deazaflavin-dependent oxidoreductase (nitroreductase family)
MRRRRHPVVLRVFWAIVNPIAKVLAPVNPFWVILETTGSRSGVARRAPLATGPHDADGMWLFSVRGDDAAWVRNLQADPQVRLRRLLRWRSGRAEVLPFDEATFARFNAYARATHGFAVPNPLLVRVTYDR